MGKLKFIFMSSYLSITSIDLTPIKAEAYWDLTPRLGFASMSGNLDFAATSLRWCYPKNSGPFSRLWIFILIILPFSFHFLKVRVDS
jgi:hypothetical protein